MENSFSLQSSNPNTEQEAYQPDQRFSLYQGDQHRALSKVIARIRESLDIETIFKTTVKEVRQLLNSDRVGVFRFYPDSGWEGEFIYEDVATEWSSALKAKLRDQCFATEFAGLYQQGRINVLHDIYQANISDCHIKLLERFQVRANIAVPLMKGKDLWGLLCIHQCSQPRQWQASEVEFAQLIAEHLGVALLQADYLEQVKIQSAQLAQATARTKVAEWQKTIAKTVEKIRQFLDLKSIFHATTEELRKLLNADRVAIYRFNPDWSGEFVFESVAAGWTSLIEEQSQRPELGENVSECSVKDLAEIPLVDTYLQDTEGGRFTRGEVYRICNDIYQADFSECYINVLESYQAKAYVIIAIYHGQKLWGLLAVYQNDSSRDWQEDEVYLLTQVGTQLGVALQQAEFLEQSQNQAAELTKAAERQRALANTVEKIRQSLDIDIIFKTTTQEVRGLLQVERVSIYRFNPDWSGEFVADSIVDGWTRIIQPQSVTEQALLPGTPPGKYARHEIFVPISQGEKLWGLLVAYQNSQARYWQNEEINLLAQVGVQLGVAIQQAETLKQVQIQAQQLAQAAERERKATEREKALAATVKKMRQSLNLDTIFATTTQEVQRLLELDRATIYRFQEDHNVEFVAESLVNNGTVNRQVVPLIIRDYFQQIQGRDYHNSKILAIKDIYNTEDYTNHISLLHPIVARAYMIVPIFQGEEIWGLLAVYQNSKSRDWQEDEIDLLVHIANQLGVGIQQAELLEQTQRQKEELTQTLTELQRTQTQLIQSEKMAGLGQVVAGVAHEINNPISFIYGNISHVTEYTENLLNLLRIYQKNYPNPKAEVKQQSAEIDIEFIAKDLPKILTSMNTGAERISELVLSLRTFSRLDEADMKPVNIHEGIDSTLMILQHRLKLQADGSGIEVVKKYSPLPPVECYAAEMNQVFMNILSNAIDAIENGVKVKKTIEQPEIYIYTELVDENSIQIRILDNGCGIPENMRSRIFDPFFTTKEPGKGTGVGLYISYQIVVEKHGGQIQCFSEPDKGSEFLIQIPIKRAVS
ncbi:MULTISPECIES: GAF domain-containing protein [unclassified Tolypothrix]|uniref:GAF domain-containing protein n=1 Tax=unclassified Tolypothrix TaxID=2649714 RepID=UPI0005EAA2E1|nr:MULTISPECIES: GAF domain-containing protein [unclassified Tolypothrix]BAY92556.1 GAF sensor signal transduction histidine kinase [Microchaete diplosiphon NIES-3275]EKF05625.1 sensor histidine kinase [Tolypothrix sp. PCC 7601]MBE9086644.1 GAF domain-containing sensor histidine kinase [Tolypothrix sp. LEGE 11397]UYD26511.1 GAF domain-containing sensor histidine kinase [Tolypothrix sp. PCC 7712]UYD31251.1 GAF domain-containing sensor histidine kinase [Tolypothrix sp. PCC 7601]